MDYVEFVYRPLAARSAENPRRPKSRTAVARSGSLHPHRRGHSSGNGLGRLRGAPNQTSTRAGGREQDERKASLLYNVIFQCALGVGAERPYAIEPVADAAWRVYRLWSAVALGLARVTPGKTTSLAFAVTNHGDPHGRVSLSFRFNAPGYLIEAAPADSGTAFDMVRCPTLNYFRGEAAIDLCSASLCNLDYALAALL